MADAVSHSSLDSTTDDYVLVNGEPKLKVMTTPRAYDYESCEYEHLNLYVALLHCDIKISHYDVKCNSLPAPILSI